MLSLTDFMGWRFGWAAKTYVVLLCLFNMSIGERASMRFNLARCVVVKRRGMQLVAGGLCRLGIPRRFAACWLLRQMFPYLPLLCSLLAEYSILHHAVRHLPPFYRYIKHLRFPLYSFRSLPG